jgi:hypothetical protein
MTIDGQKLLKDGDQKKQERKEDRKQGDEMKLMNTLANFGEEKHKKETYGRI